MTKKNKKINNMNYYTQTIPYNFAEKLKEKGMPMEVWNGTTQGMPYIVIMEKSSFDWLDKELGGTPQMVERRYTIPTYAEVFDWLMSQKIVINIEAYNADVDRTCIKFCWLIFHFEDGTNPYHKGDYTTWHEAANGAIEKALTLI